MIQQCQSLPNNGLNHTPRKMNRFNHQSIQMEKEFHQFNHFLRKMNRFTRMGSIELIGIHVSIKAGIGQILDGTEFGMLALKAPH